MAMSTQVRRRDHKYALENLSAYLDGELAVGERARVEAHLRRCVACQRELQSLRQTALLLRYAPRHAVPRSFALPASASRAQARYRGWQVGYGVLRTASVAVALMLVMLLSTDALFSSGLVAMPTHAVRTEQTRLVDVQAEDDMAAAPAAASQPGAMQQPLPTLAPLLTPAPQPAPERAEPAAAATAAEAAPVPASEVMLAAAPPAPEALPALPADTPTTVYSATDIVFGQATPSSVAPEVSVFRGVVPDAGGLGGAGGPAGAAEGGIVAMGGAAGVAEAPASAEGQAAAIQPTPPLDSSAVQRVLAPTEAPAMPAEAALVAPEQVVAPTVAAKAAPMVVSPVTEPLPPSAPLALAPPTAAPATRVEHYAVVTHEPDPAVWQLWRTLRLVSGGLFGLLLMLVAGLLWLGPKRRP